jgi:hypothetical protein
VTRIELLLSSFIVRPCRRGLGGHRDTADGDVLDHEEGRVAHQEGTIDRPALYAPRRQPGPFRIMIVIFPNGSG